MNKCLAAGFCFLFCCLILKPQQPNYEGYDNIRLSPEATSINSFAQDAQGVIWVGSNKGLFSYDGFSAQHHSAAESLTQIHCIVVLDSCVLVLGTDAGVLFYHYRQDRYLPQEVVFPDNVRALALDGDSLWIGSLDGLFRYGLKSKKLERFDRDMAPDIPHKSVYSILKSGSGRVYIGTYNGLCYYDNRAESFRRIQLPFTKPKSNQFVNIILEDSLRQCIWIGTEGALFRYDAGSERIASLQHFEGNSIKSMAIHESGTLLVGSDNGLFVYGEEANSIRQVVHDSRNNRSLSNNIIWSIFTDREKNTWLGTDYHVSLLRHNRLFRSIPISQITGVGDGNLFHSLYRDSRRWFWMGGTNGIILTDSLYGTKPVRWYQMDRLRYSIPHNRIRNIYEDNARHIWLATDGGINRYDEQTRQFVNYPIVDSTRTYNANWAYSILEDKNGKLWVGAFLGGVFVLDKQMLMKSSGVYVAEKHYGTNNGMAGNNVNQLVQDKKGDIWVLLYNNGINKIDAATGRVSRIEMEKEAEGYNPYYILPDSEGFVWVAYRNLLAKMNTETYESQAIRLNRFGECEIFSMVEAEGKIWLSTSVGILAVDKVEHRVQYVNVSSHSYTAGFYDKHSGFLFWGGSDEIAVLAPESPEHFSGNTPVVLTALYINNEPYRLQLPDVGQSIRYLNNLVLNHKQNNLIFEFSNLVYSQRESNRFVYRLKGLESDWNMLEQNTNRIVYNNLEYGEYALVVASLDTDGKPSDNSLCCVIAIRPPWYYTGWAKLIYSLLVLGLIVWTINFFRVRNNLRIERLEKTKTVELMNLKMDFFTNVSHEFKTPLSLIIAPLSNLLRNTKNPQRKAQLNIVLNNALKLNSLIRQIIDFNREDNVDAGLILSQVEFVEFAQNLFSVYEEAYKDKNIRFVFQTDDSLIYLHADLLKLEAVLNNLLSNACKYTKEGEIKLEITKDEIRKVVNVSVSDTGVGIPASEISYVFERFFQSSKTAKDKEGTGIGLYLVNNYVVQHKGIVQVQSEEGKGTVFTLSLPLVEVVSRQQYSNTDKRNDTLPLLLIVEDNPEIADFMYNLLAKSYRCQVCHNGKQGLNLCLELRPDLIIADIMMPVMDGLEMMKAIRHHAPVSDTPIILLTAKNDRTTELKSLNLKADAFISKPFDPEMLFLRIEQILERKSMLESKLRLESVAEIEPIRATSPDEKFLSEITALIEDRIDDTDLNVNTLSKISGYGTKFLYRKTKQLTGKPPVEYIRSIRLKKASMLLSKNKFSVSEVMYMVGFSNSSYFAKCFQEEFGMSPKQFMESE